MRTRQGGARMLALGLVLALSSAGLTAQRGQNMKAGAAGTDQDFTAIERSWAIQKRLAGIEANKEGFIEALLEGWAPFLDSRVYDTIELRSVLSEATPWRLYGASLVGDFETMIDVARGRQSAARSINTWSEPLPKGWTPADHDGTHQLVFNPISPCRIVDTRGSGARTGPLVVGAPRVFDLTTQGYGKGQGGQTSGCAGLPSASPYGWAVNITVVGYTAIGGLKVYPFTGAPPATSIINYVPDGWAIANNGHVTGCLLCTDDITLAAFGSNTHVIVDVMGYYDRSFFLDAVRSVMWGPFVSVAGGTLRSVSGGVCPDGTLLVGGINAAEGPVLISTQELTSAGTQWVVAMANIGSTPISAAVGTICLDVAGQ